jgi:NADH:ubiquinone oxidoreductase subunit K
MTQSMLNIVLVGVFGLFAIGLYGLLISRNLIKIVVALQILAKSAILAILVAGKMGGNIDLGQSMAIRVIVADTVVAILALALSVQVRRFFGTLDIKALSTLRR